MYCIGRSSSCEAKSVIAEQKENFLLLPEGLYWIGEYEKNNNLFKLYKEVLDIKHYGNGRWDNTFNPEDDCLG